MHEKLPVFTSKLIAGIFMNLIIMKLESVLVKLRKSYHVSPAFHSFLPPFQNLICRVKKNYVFLYHKVAIVELTLVLGGGTSGGLKLWSFLMGEQCYFK